MAKEGFSNLLGAKWVSNRQSWTNSLVLLKSAENCCFAPILDHAYYWLKCQVEVSGQECGTLLGVGAESVVVSPANKTSCSSVRWGAGVDTCPTGKTTSRPFEGRLPAPPPGTSRWFGQWRPPGWWSARHSWLSSPTPAAASRSWRRIGNTSLGADAGPTTQPPAFGSYQRDPNEHMEK